MNFSVLLLQLILSKTAGGLSKNAEFAKLCPPSERRSPESVPRREPKMFLQKLIQKGHRTFVEHRITEHKTSEFKMHLNVVSLCFFSCSDFGLCRQRFGGLFTFLGSTANWRDRLCGCHRSSNALTYDCQLKGAFSIEIIEIIHGFRCECLANSAFRNSSKLKTIRILHGPQWSCFFWVTRRLPLLHRHENRFGNSKWPLKTQTQWSSKSPRLQLLWSSIQNLNMDPAAGDRFRVHSCDCTIFAYFYRCFRCWDCTVIGLVLHRLFLLTQVCVLCGASRWEKTWKKHMHKCNCPLISQISNHWGHWCCYCEGLFCFSPNWMVEAFWRRCDVCKVCTVPRQGSRNWVWNWISDHIFFWVSFPTAEASGASGISSNPSAQAVYWNYMAERAGTQEKRLETLRKIIGARDPKC